MKVSNALVIGVLLLAFACALWHLTSVRAASLTTLCPSEVPGSLAYAGRSGLFLCRAGDAPVLITARTDATSIQFSNRGREVRFFAGQTDYAYDTKTHDLRSIKRDNGACAAALLMCRRSVQTPDRRWRLRIVEDPPRAGGLPNGATLVATSVRFTVRVHSANADDFDFAAIAPDSSVVLFWIDFDHSASMMADTVPLGAIRLSSVRQDVFAQLREDSHNGFSSNAPQVVASLGISAYPLREWISFSPDSAEIAAIAGQIRTIYQSERLVRCSVRTFECTSWNHEPGYVELEPAWSPDGTRVAFARAQKRIGSNEPGNESQWRAWNDTRRLFISRVDGKAAPTSSAGPGASWPTWIGPTQLLFISNDSLRLIDLSSGKVVTIAALVPGGIGYYGYVARSDRFAWTDNQ